MLLIHNATLIDCTGASPKPRHSVVLDGQCIQWIGPAEAVDRSQTYDREIDASGKYVMPGLIDGHIHVCWNGYENPVKLVRENDRDKLAIEGVRTLRTILESGTTTVRDIGGHDYLEMSLRRAVEAGTIPGPRMKVAGRIICMTGGHAYFIAREADGPDEIRKATREQLKKGADIIKLMATGGAATPGQDVQASQLSAEELKAAADEAHKMGKTAAAHAHGIGGIRNCIEAGLDAIEHCSFLCLDKDAARRMADRGIWFVATLGVGEGPRGGKLDALGEDFLRRAAPLKDALKKSIPLAMELGIPMASGSDAGGNEFTPHGDSMPTELGELVAHGLSTMEALCIVTRNNAKLLGMAQDIGTVEVGKLADLLILRDNPVSDVGNVRSIDYVFKGGQVVRG